MDAEGTRLPPIAGASPRFQSIPKRATQHGVFLSGAEAEICALKPGQSQLHRTNFYTTEAPALRETYISQNEDKDSVYKKDISRAMLPEDYYDRVQSIYPAHHKIKPSGAAHWSSEYDHTYSPRSVAGATPRRQRGPLYGGSAGPTCISNPYPDSIYRLEYGARGHDPRTRVAPGSKVLPVRRDELTAGTTKGTFHVPGYTGFIPTNTHQPKVLQVEQGGRERSVDKTKLTDTYHLNLPGYAGHLPREAVNDRGPRQVTTMTVGGKDLHDSVNYA